MIEQINDNVFRVHRSDLTHRPAEIFEQIQNIVHDNHSCLIARRREDANINGSIKLIEDIPNDYRSHCFVIIHRNQSYTVGFNSKQYCIVLDRYNYITSVTDKATGEEMLTQPKFYPHILSEYMQSYGVKVDYDNYMKVYGTPTD